MMNTDTIIERIRAYATHKQWKKTQLAKAAGLGDTTLRHFDSEDWNPTIKVLRCLEEVIPDDFATPSNNSS